MRGAGLFAPWGRAATSAHEPYALFDPRKEARATRLFRGRSLLLLPLVHPHSLVSRLERILVACLDCTYSAFVVPIAIAYVPPREYSFWSGENRRRCCFVLMFERGRESERARERERERFKKRKEKTNSNKNPTSTFFQKKKKKKQATPSPTSSSASSSPRTSSSPSTAPSSSATTSAAGSSATAG